MKYSIIIPTYNKLEEALKPCLESIIKYTDFIDTEVIVISNGCRDKTIEYVNGLNNPNIRLLMSDMPLGFTKAVNLGIKNAKGEYIIIQNNDTQFLPQEKNDWLNILNEPFTYDDKVAITGPMKEFCPHADREFILFFCTMIKKEIFDKIGLLDEVFSPGYGEDTDFCLRAEDAGYKVVQVPDATRTYYDVNKRTGNFPLFHEGNVTFKNWKDGDKLLAKNNKILEDRYKNPLNTSKAEQCDGYMSSTELKWLAKNAKQNKIVIELGAWHGRSTRALADNLQPDGKLYAIDHWLGSAVERDTNHASAALNEGDHAFMEFSDNLQDHILSGKCVPLRMASKNAAAWFKKHGITVDMIFIDAGHTYEEVKEDIELWLPLVKDGGILCGHDYYHDGNTWAGVMQTVDEKFGHRGTNMGYLPDNSIWRHIIKQEAVRPNVYDCFPFFNELDILEVRFNELYDSVDRFVIVEATKTHGGKDKPLNFNNNLERFKQFLNKVTYIVVEDYPTLDSWSIERHQRDQIMRGLTQCNDNDIIMITDADEIPNAEAIKNYKDGIMGFEQKLYYYKLNCQATQNWDWAKICQYKDVKEKTPCGVRYTYTAGDKLIPNGGWHFSYITDTKGIIEKIEASAHREYDQPMLKDPTRIEALVKAGKDIFDRPLTYNFVKIDNTYPKFIQKLAIKA